MGDTSDLYGTPVPTFQGGPDGTRLPPSFFGKWSAKNPDCVAKAEITESVRTFMLCFCIICACQALYFAYHCIPRAGARKRSTWDFVWIPLIESIVYGLFSTSSQVGYIRLYDGHAIVWLRSAQWLLTVPVLLMQISKMSILEVQGVDMNSMMTNVGILMIVLGFSASLATDSGIKWMFFCFGLLCMIFLFVVVWKIMGDATAYYLSLGNEEGVHTANRIRLMTAVFFLSWSFFPLFYLLSIEGTCVVGESIITVCLTVLDCFAKNIFNILLWHTLWNSRGGLNGRWTSNSHLMAVEIDALPDKELDDPSHEDSFPHVDEEAPRQLEADVVVRPGSVAASQRRSRVRSQTGSAAPMEPQYAKAHAAQQRHLNNGQGDIEFSVDQINGSLPAQVYSPRGSNVNTYPPPYPYDSTPQGHSAGLHYGQSSMAGPASILRDHAPGRAGAGSLTFTQPNTTPLWRQSSLPASADVSQAARNRDSNSMDDVVDHVRSLNQALSDLLTVEPSASAGAAARPSHAV